MVFISKEAIRSISERVKNSHESEEVIAERLEEEFVDLFIENLHDGFHGSSERVGVSPKENPLHFSHVLAALELLIPGSIDLEKATRDPDNKKVLSVLAASEEPNPAATLPYIRSAAESLGEAYQAVMQYYKDGTPIAELSDMGVSIRTLSTTIPVIRDFLEKAEEFGNHHLPVLKKSGKPGERLVLAPKDQETASFALKTLKEFIRKVTSQPDFAEHEAHFGRIAGEAAESANMEHSGQTSQTLLHTLVEREPNDIRTSQKLVADLAERLRMEELARLTREQEIEMNVEASAHVIDPVVTGSKSRRKRN